MSCDFVTMVSKSIEFNVWGAKSSGTVCTCTQVDSYSKVDTTVYSCVPCTILSTKLNVLEGPVIAHACASTHDFFEYNRARVDDVLALWRRC